MEAKVGAEVNGNSNALPSPFVPPALEKRART